MRHDAPYQFPRPDWLEVLKAEYVGRQRQKEVVYLLAALFERFDDKAITARMETAVKGALPSAQVRYARLHSGFEMNISGGPLTSVEYQLRVRLGYGPNYSHSWFLASEVSLYHDALARCEVEMGKIPAYTQLVGDLNAALQKAEGIHKALVELTGYGPARYAIWA